MMLSASGPLWCGASCEQMATDTDNVSRSHIASSETCRCTRSELNCLWLDASKHGGCFWPDMLAFSLIFLLFLFDEAHIFFYLFDVVIWRYTGVCFKYFSVQACFKWFIKSFDFVMNLGFVWLGLVFPFVSRDHEKSNNFSKCQRIRIPDGKHIDRFYDSFFFWVAVSFSLASFIWSLINC